ncbi:SIMPL domain-containing protein [Profundibacter sp.]|uniref:SIMPL domain-containing protein n=1 Tax=Profundibacter sp. TaxID=3101071 RepID=UPI003D0A0CB3
MRNVIVALVLLMAVPVMAQESRRIVVNGHGVIETVPDMATISMGVVSEAKTAGAAMAKNTDALEGVLLQLAEAGIESRDIQTNNLSLSPRWDNRSSSVSGQPQINGFIATNTVSVRVRDLAQLGKVLDAVVQNGANSFNGLSFGLQDMEPARNEARVAAIKDAMAKAQLYATAAGVELGDVVSISDGAVRSVGPVMMQADMMRSAAVPVAQGELSVTADVTVVFGVAE